MLSSAALSSQARTRAWRALQQGCFGLSRRLWRTRQVDLARSGWLRRSDCPPDLQAPLATGSLVPSAQACVRCGRHQLPPIHIQGPGPSSSMPRPLHGAPTDGAGLGHAPQRVLKTLREPAGLPPAVRPLPRRRPLPSCGAPAIAARFCCSPAVCSGCLSRASGRRLPVLPREVCGDAGRLAVQQPHQKLQRIHQAGALQQGGRAVGRPGRAPCTGHPGAGSAASRGAVCVPCTQEPSAAATAAAAAHSPAG